MNKNLYKEGQKCDTKRPPC